MKALNRAIARTTGHIIDLCAFHIDRTGTQGCAVKQTPETLKQLEQHLAALLEMERKQLEGTPLQPHANDNAQAVASEYQDTGAARALGITPEGIAAQMQNYQIGDMLEYKGKSDSFFTNGKLYEVLTLNAGRSRVGVKDDNGRPHGLTQMLAEFINRGQPAPVPDAIDMADPRNWQAGDVVKRRQYPKSPNFTAYREYTVAENDGRYIRINGNDGTPTSYDLDDGMHEPASNFFAWVRHGESEVAA